MKTAVITLLLGLLSATAVLRAQVVRLTASGTITAVESFSSELIGTPFTVTFDVDSRIPTTTDEQGTQYWTAPPFSTDGATITSFGGSTYKETASLLHVLSDTISGQLDGVYGFRTTGLEQGYFQSGIELLSTDPLVAPTGAITSLRDLPMSAFNIKNSFSFYDYEQGSAGVQGVVTTYSVLEIPEPAGGVLLAIGLGSLMSCLKRRVDG